MALGTRNNLVIWTVNCQRIVVVLVLYNAMSWKKVMNFGENPFFHHLHKKRASNYSFPVVILDLLLPTLACLVGFCREL